MELTFNQFRKILKSTACPCCGHETKHQRIDHYDHESGWEVQGFEKKQWLSIHCHTCNYDISLNKLGVPRNLALFQETVKTIDGREIFIISLKELRGFSVWVDGNYFFKRTTNRAIAENLALEEWTYSRKTKEAS